MHISPIFLRTILVMLITKNIAGNNYKVYFDNYFTSIPLINDLKQKLLQDIFRRDRKELLTIIKIVTLIGE